MEYFLATVNLLSRTCLDFEQQVGYCITPEILIIFRSAHHGHFF